MALVKEEETLTLEERLNEGIKDIGSIYGRNHWKRTGGGSAASGRRRGEKAFTYAFCR